ncbi:MAG TPA: hypothetical protein ENF32_03265 [Thermosulfidibacter takaii]|uniref:Terminase large subunit gp17-like C-terminal domain-containing protein n=1 Tax=Thermosulfidibacter takaii TaxID=412593 RepID=A0A7C0U624_9BACT|nr:hypothetical protein [Thermosulfidibacter takaii]
MAIAELARRLEGKADPAREARKERARQDFAFFFEYYIAPQMEDYVPSAPYQLALIRTVSTRRLTREDALLFRNLVLPERRDLIRPTQHLRGLLDLEPRDHGKTSRMTQALPLWLIVTQQRVFPVTIHASENAARDVLSSIKLELENNERILEDFGDLKGRTWSSRKIVLANGNALAALGAGQSIRGIKDKYRRPTHIICDDLLKDDDVESASRREAVYRWFKRAVMNLGKDALIVVVNTIMHPDDLPSRLKNEIKKGKLKGWVCLWLRAHTPEGQPIWPQRWSLEDLRQKREDVGEDVWATEFCNDPVPEGSKKFRKDWFVFYDVAQIDPTQLVITCAVDPATGTSTGDYTAVVAVGVPKGFRYPIYVLEAWGARCSEFELLAKLVDLYGLYPHMKMMGFEEQNFQKIYKNLCIREAWERYGVKLPVKGIKQTGAKALRIASLSPLVEAGVIRFRKTQTLLLDQLEAFPKGHDDLPDALEMAVSLLPKQNRIPKAIPLRIRRQAADILRRY